MNSKFAKVCLILLTGLFVVGGAYAAQDDERSKRDKQKTKQAQAVSIAVYVKILQAQ